MLRVAFETSSTITTTTSKRSHSLSEAISLSLPLSLRTYILYNQTRADPEDHEYRHTSPPLRMRMKRDIALFLCTSMRQKPSASREWVILSREIQVIAAWSLTTPPYFIPTVPDLSPAFASTRQLLFTDVAGKKKKGMQMSSFFCGMLEKKKRK